jgi:hypothetical protein
VTDRIFLSGSGIELANALAPVINEKIPQDYPPLDALNGIAVLLTRRLGVLERDGEPLTQEWVKQFSLFILGRFAGLND